MVPGEFEGVGPLGLGAAHPHSPKGYLPKAAIPRREFLNDGGLMPAAGPPGRVDETHRRV